MAQQQQPGGRCHYLVDVGVILVHGSNPAATLSIVHIATAHVLAYSIYSAAAPQPISRRRPTALGRHRPW